MAGNDEIKDLFSKSFENFEKPVDPGLWDKIQTNLNNVPASGSGGASSMAAKAGLVKTIAVGVVSVAAISAGVWWMTKSDDKSENNTDQNKQTVVQNQEVVSEIKNEDFVVIENNTKTVDEIDKSEDPVIKDQKEEIKQKVLSDIHKNAPINSTDINNLLDQDLLDKLSKKEDQVKQDDDNKNVNPVHNPNNEEKKVEESTNHVNPSASDKEVQIARSNAEIYLEDIPNVLTPNGDRINDEIHFTHEDIASFELLIFGSQSGELVFKSEGKTLTYKGLDNFGNVLEEGNYRMLLVAKDLNGKRLVRKSFLYIKK